MARDRYDINKSTNLEWGDRISTSRKPVPIEADTPEVEELTVLQTEKKGVVVNCFFVNVRSTPESVSNANVLGQAQKGSEWVINKSVGSYYQIDFKGRPAYIAKKFMEETNG